jgi:glycosyltransferase involved in cell wall biosynthesis
MPVPQHTCPPRRILHVITRLDLGGSAENTLLTAIGLAERGCEVKIIAGPSANPVSATEKTAIEKGVAIERIPSLLRNISIVNDSLALAILYKRIKSGRYDCVHTHTSKAGILGRIAARLAGVPVIVHTPHGHIFYGYFSWLLTQVFIVIERFIFPFTDIMITLTDQEKKETLHHKIGSDGRMVRILSGIDLGPFCSVTKANRSAAIASLGLKETDFVVGTVARLVTIKNHAVIVAAAEKLKDGYPGIRFVFVGDGDLLDGLKERVAAAGIDKSVLFAGWKDREELLAILPAFDIFALCSINEGMGRAFIEAQAAGVPVIGSRVCGIPEVIQEGETGFCVALDDVDALVEKIAWMYNNRSELAAMGEKGRTWARRHFSKEIMVEKIDAVYQDLFRKKGL